MRFSTAGIDPGPELGQFIHDGLAALAQSHVDKYQATMGIIPYDPEKYEFQDKFYVAGEPNDIPTLRVAAGLLEPEFATFENNIRCTQNAVYFDRAAELIEDDKNVILLTPHHKMTDIAFATAAVKAYVAERVKDFETGISIGKVVTAVEHKLYETRLPAVEALQRMLCDHIFLSFPQTKRMRSSPFAEPARDYIRENNNRMKDQVEIVLNQGRQLVGIAGGGGTNSPVEDTHVMQPITRGTAEMCKHEDTYVFPVAMWLEKGNGCLQPISEPIQVSDKAELDYMMQDMAAFLTWYVADGNFVYEPAAESQKV